MGVPGGGCSLPAKVPRVEIWALGVGWRRRRRRQRQSAREGPGRTEREAEVCCMHGDKGENRVQKTECAWGENPHVALSQGSCWRLRPTNVRIFISVSLFSKKHRKNDVFART